MTLPKKLTKRYFISLPAGSVLISGVTDSDAVPKLVTAVKPADERQEQWSQIVQMRVDQRNCYWFPSQAEYIKWWGSLVKNIPERLRSEPDVTNRPV